MGLEYHAAIKGKSASGALSALDRPNNQDCKDQKSKNTRILACPVTNKSLFYFFQLAARSIQCYQCPPRMTSNCTSFTPKHCSKSQTRLTCPEGMDFCMRSRLHGKNKNVITDIERRSCANTRTCYSLSQACDYYHRNDSGLKCDWSCCNKDLCNAMSRPLALCVTPVLVLWVVERWVLDVLGCY